MAIIKKIITSVLSILILSSASFAQSITNTRGVATQIVTTNRSTTITVGGTFQTVTAVSSTRMSITIQNNNPLSGTEYCYIYVGVGTASTAASIVLGPGGSYQRYWPNIPSDPIQATCTTTNDTLYIDTQE